MSHVLHILVFIATMNNAGYGGENHSIIVSEADIKPFNE